MGIRRVAPGAVLVACAAAGWLAGGPSAGAAASQGHGKVIGYGQLQISVPSTWRYQFQPACPPQGGGAVLIGPPPTAPLMCPFELAGRSIVDVSPLSDPVVPTTTGVSAVVHEVHGLTVDEYQVGGTAVWHVPSLHVQVAGS